MNRGKRINQYQETYRSQYGFEAEMVKYRRKFVMERLCVIRPKVVLEVGCGAELLYQHYLQIAGEAERWVIVEPASEFHAVAAASGLPNLLALQGFLEDSADRLRECLPTPPDMIIISSVLHEVESPVELLDAAKRLMGEQSVLHLNVPNATSFHRMLAKSMGLIDDVKTLSARNLDLLQHRVYDAGSLRRDVESAGLAVVSEGGYLVKPFTHAQMQAISPVLGETVLDGLYQLGKAHPELASEIYLEARKA
jgi:hypothetical protein